MHRLMRRIYRERRRVGLVTVLAGMAGYLFYWRFEMTLPGGMPLSVFAAVTYAIGFGVSTLVVSLILPNLRFAMEAFAVARLLFAATAAVVPAVGLAAVTNPFLNATVVVGGGMLLSLLVYGDRTARLFAGAVAVARVRLPAGAPLPARLAAPDHVLERLCYKAGGRGPRAHLHRLLSAAGPVPRVALFAAWLDDAWGRLHDCTAATAPRPVAVAPRLLPVRAAVRPAVEAEALAA